MSSEISCPKEIFESVGLFSMFHFGPLFIGFLVLIIILIYIGYINKSFVPPSFQGAAFILVVITPVLVGLGVSSISFDEKGLKFTADVLRLKCENQDQQQLALDHAEKMNNDLNELRKALIMLQERVNKNPDTSGNQNQNSDNSTTVKIRETVFIFRRPFVALKDKAKAIEALFDQEYDVNIFMTTLEETGLDRPSGTIVIRYKNDSAQAQRIDQKLRQNFKGNIEILKTSAPTARGDIQILLF